MVLIHGTRSSRAQWEGYDALLPDADVLAIDLPGHGAFEGGTCTYDDVVQAFDDALSEADDGQPVILVGHSLGGYLAGMYAQRLADDGRDDALAALVLVGTTADPASRLAGIYKGFAKLLPVIGFERMTAIANFFYRALGSKAEQPGPESYSALADAWALVFEHCGPHNLRAVTCPVVLINGQFDQMRIHVKQFAAESPGAAAHVVKGASHLLPQTHPKELGALLGEVARRVGDGGAAALEG